MLYHLLLAHCLPILAQRF